MQEYNIKVSPEQAGMRLDMCIFQFAKEHALGLSRTFIKKLIEEEKVVLDNVAHVKSHQKVKAGDEFKIFVEEKIAPGLEPEDIELEVIYEDKDLAIINKPSGIVVHPAPGNYTHTLVNALLHRFKDLSDINPKRPGIIHRLDKETSGLLVVAKNNAAHLGLSAQFAEHSITRKYIAVVKGRMELDGDVIDLPIGRHPVKRKSMSVSFGEDTKYAKTRYRTLKRAEDFSVVELEPFTGRTHQLRVHI